MEKGKALYHSATPLLAHIIKTSRPGSSKMFLAQREKRINKRKIVGSQLPLMLRHQQKTYCWKQQNITLPQLLPLLSKRTGQA